jgi:hypothetical protein
VTRIPLKGLGKRGATFKAPPVEVPEYEIFSVLENQRRAVVRWMDEHADQVNAVLRKAVTIGFHVHLQEESGATTWTKLARGVYHEEHMRVTVDLQSGEILSNRQETRPVPDSMSQFADFETVFGKETLRCASVSVASPLQI